MSLISSCSLADNYNQGTWYCLGCHRNQLVVSTAWHVVMHLLHRICFREQWQIQNYDQNIYHAVAAFLPSVRLPEDHAYIYLKPQFIAAKSFRKTGCKGVLIHRCSSIIPSLLAEIKPWQATQKCKNSAWPNMNNQRPRIGFIAYGWETLDSRLGLIEGCLIPSDCPITK